MKNKFTHDDIVARMKAIDKRVETMTPALVDTLMDRGYALLVSQYGYSFTNEDVVSLDEYYTAGELLLSLDVEDDVVDIYSLYVTRESLDKDVYKHGICREYNERYVYRDNRYSGRVHVDLNGTTTNQFDNVVIKYCYTPKSTDDDIMLDSITMTALEYAFATAIYSYVKDSDSKKEAAADMIAIGSSITMPPEDEETQVRSIF